MNQNIEKIVLSEAEVVEALGISKSLMRTMIREKTAPPRIQLGVNRFGFPVKDLMEWISNRVERDEADTAHDLAEAGQAA